MISYQNFEIYASLTLFIVIKILSVLFETYRISMYDKKSTLTSIPEKNECEDDIVKWVPKKKHEVLKAKYKCLKKLFQVYDASVIGILPENYPDYVQPERTHRRKRSHRTKTDACAGTTEPSNGNVSLTQTEKSAATSVLKDLNLQYSTDVSKTTVSKVNEKSDKSTQDSKEDLSNDSDCVQTNPHPIPYLILNEKRRPTRLQSFINRIFGIKPERRYFPSEHVYAASDNNISNRYEKRRRRSLRFRRRRPKKIYSEVTLRDIQSPVILSYVQSVQKNCLMDTTPRQCPILGCRMIFYGIINYNDHLNLCHFPDRKYICHYCHEGFSREYDKIVHENEHLGITKIAAALPPSPSMARPSAKVASNTQTEPEMSKIDVPEKLKKIVSFFDKISDPDQVIEQIRKTTCSETNLESFQQSSKTATETDESSESGQRTNSQNAGRNIASSADSGVTSNFPCGHRVTCRFCGEHFDFRRQLSLHVDLEHRVHDKFSKFHSCPGIVDCRTQEIVSEDGRINVQSIGPVSSQSTYYEVSRRKSNETISCEPSTNIVYYASADSIGKKSSVVGSFVQKIRSYKWEPGSKIIRV